MVTLGGTIKKTSLYLLFLLITISYASADLIINEIMAAPITDESLNEWIELYNDGDEEINVSNFVIGDESGNDILEGGLYNGLGTIIPSNSYAIITDEATRAYNNFNFNPEAIKLYVDDSSIGNGLKNSGEIIYLYDNNENLIYQVNYSQTDKGKCFSFLNNSWYEADCTPGYNNDGTQIYQLQSIEGNNCDWEIEILLNKTVFENKDEFEWQMRATKINGDSTNITGRATIEDLFGNIMKEYKPWTNSSSTYKKTSTKYSPSLEEGKPYTITANLQVQCDDTNLDNNIDQKTITIKGSSQGNVSSINIEKIYDLGTDNIAKFGQTIRPKLIIYKGDTTKNVITAWVENEDDRISKQSKTNIYTKFTENTITIPIQLKPNCDYKYDDGTYKIKVEGIDASAEMEIEVEDITDNLCETTLVYKEPSEVKFYYELIDWPSEIENNKEFEIKVKIDNNEEKDHEVYIWSYIYRGPKSYSGEREYNLKHLTLKRRRSREIILRNTITEAKPGEYNLMVKIIKDNQKTEKKITQKIKVIEEEIEEIIQETEERIELKEQDKEDYSTTLESTRQPKTIYESSTIKAQRIGAYIFIALLVIYAAILTLKK